MYESSLSLFEILTKLVTFEGLSRDRKGRNRRKSKTGKNIFYGNSTSFKHIFPDQLKRKSKIYSHIKNKITKCDIISKMFNSFSEQWCVVAWYLFLLFLISFFFFFFNQDMVYRKCAE